VLVLDQVQKISGWSESVKRLWDEDTRAGRVRGSPFKMASRRCPRPSTPPYLQELEGIGVLTSEKPGREVIYKHRALVEVLTA
jgi:hypothetical protein